MPKNVAIEAVVLQSRRTNRQNEMASQHQGYKFHQLNHEHSA